MKFYLLLSKLRLCGLAESYVSHVFKQIYSIEYTC